MICALVAALALSAPATAVQRAESLVIQIRNRVGVTAQVAVYFAKTDNDLLNDLTGGGAGAYFPDEGHRLVLRSGSIYYLIPWGLLHDAAQEGTRQVVTLGDGTQLRGQILSVVTTYDGRTYNLSSATHLSIIALPATRSRGSPSNPADEWRLGLSGGLRDTLRVTSPCFATRYYSTAGYAVGGIWLLRTVTAFGIRLGSDTTLVNLGDLESITYANGPARPSTVEVKPKGATPSRGVFVFETRWLLLGDLPNGVKIALEPTQDWTLLRRSP